MTGSGILHRLHQVLVNVDGALLASDILGQDLLDEGIGGGFVAAVRDLQPFFGADRRGAAELDDAQRQHIGVSQLFSGVQKQLRGNRIFHRAFDNLGAQPVLVVRQPFIRKSLVEHPQQLIDIHTDNLTSFCTHRFLLLFAL